MNPLLQKHIKFLYFLGGGFFIFLSLVFVPSKFLVFAVSPPSIPVLVYGDVIINDELSPKETIISVENNGEEVASVITSEVGKYFIEVPAENKGDELIYKVNGLPAAERECPNPITTASIRIDLEVSGGTITYNEGDEVKGKGIVITPNNSTTINIGNSLSITIESGTTSTSTVIEKIEKLENDFFTGATAVLAGNNVLNAYEIKITGTDITITVTISYNDTGIDVSTIAPYRYDGTSWVPITSPSPIIDTVNKTVTFEISAGGTPYGVFGKTAAPATTPPSPGGGSSGGGGGLPPNLQVLIPPVGGFKIVINNEESITDSRNVILILYGGPNTERMAISNWPDFKYANQEKYVSAKNWTLTEGEGLKTVYVKFFTQYGYSSEIVSATIELKPKVVKPPVTPEPQSPAPEVKGLEVKGIEFYADGSLLRGTDMKVYILIDGKKKHILNLVELHKYVGQPIYNVSDAVIAQYPSQVSNGFKTITNYPDGTLLRGPDKKTYIIEAGKKRQVTSLLELMKYLVTRKVYKVEQEVLDQY